MTRGRSGPNDPRQLGWLTDDRGPHLAQTGLEDADTLASAIDRRLRLGTSSWSFPGWEGLIYDRHYSDKLLSERGLLAYARHPLLRSVGIDRGFYGPIAMEVLQRWASQVPSDFRFLIKADAKLTSPWGRGRNAAAAAGRSGDAIGRQTPAFATAPLTNEDFLSAEFARRFVFEPARDGLGDRLGCLLLQFPPFDPRHYGGVERLAQRLRELGKAMDRDIPCSVEFRHPAWLSPAVSETLVDLGWSWGLVVWPGMPDLRDQLRVAAASCRKRLVVRWMLHSGLTYAAAVQRYEPFDQCLDPDPVTRDTIARILLRAIERDVDESYVIVNNKAEGSSPRSILALAERLAQGPRSPPLARPAV